MNKAEHAAGSRELRSARSALMKPMLAAVCFSVFVNLLLLTGPLYMLQVYDRVLGSGSEETLVALSLLVVCLFLVMGVLDFLRGHVMSLVGAAFQQALDRRIYQAALERAAAAPNDPLGLTAQRDLESIRGFLASPVLMALIDLPWTPIFTAAIFIFHPLLGWMSVAGGLFLVLTTWAYQVLSRGPQLEAGRATVVANRLSDQLKNDAESLQALGMAGTGFDRWQVARVTALDETTRLARLTGAFGALTKTFRLFLQSAMLGLGAWLVLQNELTAGAMIAGSILLGRALAPVELAVSQWSVTQRAVEGWTRLSELLSRAPAQRPRTRLPRPRAVLEVETLSVAPPGENAPVLRMVSFRIAPGQALGVIGPSGSGKSTLARALTGTWKPYGGKIRLDGATLEQYDPDVYGRLIGYLPQRITLFDGSIAENIARLDTEPDSTAVVAAARKADAHDMILRLPQGYDTRITANGGRLSGGQMQRIGLARALYGDPVLLILDEPNSNLDNEGSVALNSAIRTLKAEGTSLLIMAHRPAAIQECDLLLVIEDGMSKGFGPRDEILQKMVRNHRDLVKPPPPEGPQPPPGGPKPPPEGPQPPPERPQ